MHKISYIETKRIKNPHILAEVIYNNFNYLRAFPELMHNKREIIESLKNDGSLCYLVYEISGKNSNLIAYLVGDFKMLNDNRYVYYISYLYVAEKFRKRGVGTKLMNMLINKCKTDGVNFIVLTCDTNDKKILNFYKKYGFKNDPLLGNNFKRHNVYSLFL